MRAGSGWHSLTTQGCLDGLSFQIAICQKSAYTPKPAASIFAASPCETMFGRRRKVLTLRDKWETLQQGNQLRFVVQRQK